jgi:hypothetical protein
MLPLTDDNSGSTEVPGVFVGAAGMKLVDQWRN